MQYFLVCISFLVFDVLYMYSFYAYNNQKVLLLCIVFYNFAIKNKKSSTYFFKFIFKLFCIAVVHAWVNYHFFIQV